MTTSKSTSSVRPIPTSEGSQTLVEYLRIVEPPPLPGPKPVNILDVLVSVYSEPAGAEAIDTIKSEESVAIDNGAVEPIALQPARGAYNLARFAAISSVVGWFLLFILFSSLGALFFFCLEGLALVLATASYCHPNDSAETRPLRIIAFALSVGWIPVVCLFLFGGPAIVLFVIVAVVCLLAKIIAVSDDTEKTETLLDPDF